MYTDCIHAYLTYAGSAQRISTAARLSAVLSPAIGEVAASIVVEERLYIPIAPVAH